MHSLMNLGRVGYSDFSSELRDKEDWNVGSLKAFEHHFDVVAFAIDPVTSLLAIGTIGGVIRIFGAPGVEATLVLSGSIPVKFLRFAPNLLKLVCIDENDRLYLWDLTSFGQIKLEVTTRFDRPVTSVAVSPSHTHAFVALETGVVKTYDLLCRRISPYTIPSAWQLYEEKMLSDGLTTSTDPSARIPVDVVIHPRNLDLVFVVYGGGVVLIDLKERNTVRVYELLIPAGAPGGLGYLAPDLLSHRRPAAASFAIHPAGHFFVVGYTDGSIAFWAVEDEDRPLLVRTLDDLDINVVDGEKLEEYLPDGSHTQKSDKAQFNPREPIFKLAWSGYPNSSDPRCGPTSLIVLGGQFSGDPSGVNVLWLRAFNPPAPPAAVLPLNEGLQPHFRTAMRESLELLDAYFYETYGLTQDFLLVPRASPYFDGTWDPKAILLLFEAEEHTRAIKALQFPPPAFSAEPPLMSSNSTATKVEDSSTDSLTKDLASTLQSMSTSDGPKELLLPSALWSGPDAVLQAMLVSVDRTAYEQLIKGAEDWSDDFKMAGGVAAPDEEILNDIKFAKFEPHRLLITRHEDLTVRFSDISVQLLIPSATSPLTSAFPRPLSPLTIDLVSLLGSSIVTSHIPPRVIGQERISEVIFAPEGLEVAIVLATGEVFIYRLQDGPRIAVERQLPDEQIVLLESSSIEVGEGLRFRPFFMVKPKGAPTSVCALADIGFLAVGYTDGSLNIVDMRGPNILLHVDGETAQKKRRLSLLTKHSGADPVASLTWTICTLGRDPAPRIRLIAVHASGLTNVYTLRRAPSGSWFIPPIPRSSSQSLLQAEQQASIQEFETIASPLPKGVFVLEARGGVPCRADRARLALALEHESDANPVKLAAARSRSGSRGSKGSSVEVEDSGPKCFLVIAGARGARSFEDLGDGKAARTDWPSKAGLVTAAQVVERNGSYALAAFTDKHEAITYSLPALEHMHTLEFASNSSLPVSPDITGDFLAITPLLSRTSSSPSITSGSSKQSSLLPPSSPIRRMHLLTLFDIRRGYHTPLVSLVEHQDGSTVGAMPAQPQPVSMAPAGLLTWLGGLVGQGAVRGDEIDALLAGPDRPIPERNPAREAAQGNKYVEWEDNKAGAVSSYAQSQSSLYYRLHRAMGERGEMLDDLEDRFNSLEEGSKSMVSQAKRLATQQAAKSWLPW